ncbi:hypothetical protein BGZ70_005640 [Mortierella alpina]|uniref:F-box domain-containing protein n=1 Tax=Mortierella alpina TaxID=64518 RepID=A0A9P6M4E5_MORAP|nr:hypothetical protein BGZ70_005640 [Mortierella alpina]
MATFSTLPAEIHLLAQQYLSNNDILACILVDRRCFALYSPCLWRTVNVQALNHIWRPNDHGVRKGPCSEQAGKLAENPFDIKHTLQKYCHHVRSLAVDSLESFHTHSPAFTNLTSLRLGILYTCEGWPTTLDAGFKENYVFGISSALKQNRHLKSVSLKLSRKFDPTPLIKALVSLPFLDNVDLDWRPTAEEVSQLSSDPALDSMLHAQHLVQILDSCRQLCRLRLADISRCGSFHSDEHVWLLLGRCPNLVSASLPGELSKSDVDHIRDILSEHCPFIGHLAFTDSLPSGDGPDHGNLGEVIAAVPGLKHLTIRQATIPQRLSIVDMLLQPQTSQLESLELARLYEIGMQGADVPMILACLPRLKRFISDTPLSVSKAIEVYHACKRQSSPASWSADLKVLDIRLHRSLQEEVNLSPEDQAEFMSWISCSFKKLESLTIRHWDTVGYKFAPMSREVRLDIPEAQASLSTMQFLNHLEIFDSVLPLPLRQK